MSCAHDEARAKARRFTTQHHTHACSGADMRPQPDCEGKRDPDLDEDRIKDENMELDPNARSEKRTSGILSPTAERRCESSRSFSLFRDLQIKVINR